MTPFPWDTAMRFGFGILRLSPNAFWAMTPRELGAAYKAFYGDAAPLNRQRLDALMTSFPDKETENGRC